jgi:Arc/MetJ-type ribon-helix-helix transcriptional regulator
LMSVTVTVRVRRELVELADRMVELGLARSRSHAFNLMIEKGLRSVMEEVERWENIYRKAGELEKRKSELKEGSLGKLLEEK